MTTPELKIDPKLPVMAFNFDQLKAWATALADRSANLVVTEAAVADVKRDMAELNKAKKTVDDARKEAVRRVSEPIRAFEAQIKEVCGIFDDAYSKLGSQVKVFEDAQREEKHNTVLELIGQCFADAFGAHGDWPEFEIPVQEKWLNKTTSLKSIREDIAAIIQRHIEEAQRKAALEQARQDRAAAIESHVKALNQQHGLELPVHRFMITCLTDMSVPLEQAHRRIDDVFANEVELRQAEESTRKKLDSACKSQPAAHPGDSFADYGNARGAEQQQSKPAPPAQTRAMSIVIEYDVANEEKVKACLETLKTLCVNFGARYRQE